MNSLKNCQGICHNCSSKECENHPMNYSRALNYAGAILLNNEEEVLLLEKLMNSKLKQGLAIMEFEDTESNSARDYELTDRDRELVAYAESVIERIYNPANDPVNQENYLSPNHQCPTCGGWILDDEECPKCTMDEEDRIAKVLETAPFY